MFEGFLETNHYNMSSPLYEVFQNCLTRLPWFNFVMTFTTILRLMAPRIMPSRLSRPHLLIHAHAWTRNLILSGLQTCNRIFSDYSPTRYPSKNSSTFQNIIYSRYYHSTCPLQKPGSSESQAFLRRSRSLGGLRLRIKGRQNRQRQQVFNPILLND